MSKHQDYVQKTEALVEPILQKHQFELVDVEFVKEAGSWHLRVYIDKEGGITIDDLTLVNHELSDEMDKDDFIEEYNATYGMKPDVFSEIHRTLRDTILSVCLHFESSILSDGLICFFCLLFPKEQT